MTSFLMTGTLALTSRFHFPCYRRATILLILAISLTMNELKSLTGNVAMLTSLPVETNLQVRAVMILLLIREKSEQV